MNAQDTVGNVASLTHTYSVTYNFSGFFSPLKSLQLVNGANSGQVIPVKLRLSGPQGLDILADGYPKSEVIPCDSTRLVDGTETVNSPGRSSLLYDASADEYTFVWKTERAWAMTCRQLVVKLNDGTLHRANFRFK